MDLKGISTKINAATNRVLTRPMSKCEIKAFVFSINPFPAPGDNGFTAKFYQFFWKTIKEMLFKWSRVFSREIKI